MNPRVFLFPLRERAQQNPPLDGEGLVCSIAAVPFLVGQGMTKGVLYGSTLVDIDNLEADPSDRAKPRVVVPFLHSGYVDNHGPMAKLCLNAQQEAHAVYLLAGHNPRVFTNVQEA